jgi:hypothetical protein
MPLRSRSARTGKSTEGNSVKAGPQAPPTTRDTCKLCYHAITVSFVADNYIWQQTVPANVRDRPVCLGCFIRLADEKLLPWDRGIQFFPISLHKIVEAEKKAA